MFSRDLRYARDAVLGAGVPPFGREFVHAHIAAHGHEYLMQAVQAGGKRYLIVYSGEWVAISPSCPSLVRCRHPEKVAVMGEPVSRNHKLVNERWPRNRFIPDFDHLRVSLLRYYTANSGDFLSCIFAGVPGLPGINVEIVYHCSTRPEHRIVFGEEPLSEDE